MKLARHRKARDASRSPTRRCPRSPSSRRSSSTTRRNRPAYVRSHTALLAHDPGAGVRRVQPRRRAVRRSHQGLPPEVGPAAPRLRRTTAGCTMRDEATFRVKAGLAEMLKGGVIMDVVDAEQAKIAEDAGAAAVMALERVPADIRRDGGVARMSRPGDDQGHPGGRDDPRHGQGAHRPLRRGAGARGARGRLHRRVRGPDARRRGQPHRQVGVHGRRSCAARRTSARRCGASARARR